MVITWLLKRNKFLKEIFEKQENNYNNISTKLSHQQDQLNGLVGNLEEVRKSIHKPTPLTSAEKQVKKFVDNQKLMKAIHSCIKEGYSTTRIKEDITLRFGIKKTKFFKYLNLVRKNILEPSSRTSIIKINQGENYKEE